MARPQMECKLFMNDVGPKDLRPVHFVSCFMCADMFYRRGECFWADMSIASDLTNRLDEYRGLRHVLPLSLRFSCFQTGFTSRWQEDKASALVFLLAVERGMLWKSFKSWDKPPALSLIQTSDYQVTPFLCTWCWDYLVFVPALCSPNTWYSQMWRDVESVDVDGMLLEGHGTLEFWEMKCTIDHTMAAMGFWAMEEFWKQEVI